MLSLAFHLNKAGKSYSDQKACAHLGIPQLILIVFYDVKLNHSSKSLNKEIKIMQNGIFLNIVLYFYVFFSP